jgi:CRP-like cAMP-binding protein
MEALSRVPLFFSLNEEELIQVSQAAQLLVCSRGTMIIREGDRDRSMYIVLDGRVRVFTRDNQGKRIQLAVLSENHFFGEISLLAGVPRTANVQAVDESLLCKLSFEAIQDITQKFPFIKTQLETCYRERLKDAAAKKRTAGFVERREDPRCNLGLTARFSVSPTSEVSEQFRGKTFESTSLNVSVAGMSLELRDDSLRELPSGCTLHLEISLPDPWGSVRCLGALRNRLQGKDDQGFWTLGIEFTEMIPVHREKLEDFLSG